MYLPKFAIALLLLSGITAALPHVSSLIQLSRFLEVALLYVLVPEKRIRN